MITMGQYDLYGDHSQGRQRLYLFYPARRTVDLVALAGKHLGGVKADAAAGTGQKDYFGCHMCLIIILLYVR